MSSAICFNLDQSKILSSGNGLKVSADDKLNVPTIVISAFDRIENVGRGENAGYQHFLLFP